jgi:predicted DsbA family dithiol-disulfide isomerase
MSDADIHFYLDPVCPFAWMTSKWGRQVTAQRDYTVDWRFISLRMINVRLRLRLPTRVRRERLPRLTMSAQNCTR